MLITALAIESVLPELLSFVGDNILIGHNINFDINFIYDNCEEILNKPFTNDFVDTMRLSRRLFPLERHHRLTDLVERFGIDSGIEHRALSDVNHTYRCYLYMKQFTKDNDISPASLFYVNKKISARDIHSTSTDFDESSIVYGKQFVFTGALERMTRKEAMQMVVDHGGLCGDGISQKTNFLVLGNNDYCTTIKDGKSSKQKKAEQLKLSGSDIEIISENVFCDLFT